MLLLFVCTFLCIHTSGQQSEKALRVQFLEPLQDERFQSTRAVDITFVADQHEGMNGRVLLLKLYDQVVSSFSLPDGSHSEHTVRMIDLNNGIYELSVELDGQPLASTTFIVDVVPDLLRVEDDAEEDSAEVTDPPARDPICEAQNLTLRKNEPKVFDTFIFNGEIDLLEVRLEELDSVVDVFVIVEGSKTFQNQPKELKLMQVSMLRIRHAIPRADIGHIIASSQRGSHASCPRLSM